MSIDKLKTKFFNGAFINNVKHYFDKINEIIDYLNNLVIPDTPNYKIYRAILNQSSTNAPVPTVLENTLGGTVTWSYNSTGSYLGTLTGAFDSAKTMVSTGSYNSILGAQQYFTISGVDDINAVYVATYSVSEQDAGGNLLKTAANGILYRTFIEIIVYN